MTLVQLTKQAPRSEALIRVYKNQISLNAAAARLLNLSKGDMINVLVDAEAKAAGRGDRLYIGKAKGNAYAVASRGHSFRVCSAVLSRSIANALDGCGTYRICPEDSATNALGHIYYNIFFKKYHD